MRCGEGSATGCRKIPEITYEKSNFPWGDGRTRRKSKRLSPVARPPSRGPDRDAENPVRLNGVEPLVGKARYETFSPGAVQPWSRSGARPTADERSQRRCVKSDSPFLRLRLTSFDRRLKLTISFVVNDRLHGPRRVRALAKISSAATPSSFPVRNSSARRSTALAQAAYLGESGPPSEPAMCSHTSWR